MAVRKGKDTSSWSRFARRRQKRKSIQNKRMTLTSRTRFCASDVAGLLVVVGGHSCCTLLCTDSTRTNSGLSNRHWMTLTSGSHLLPKYMPFFFNCKCTLCNAAISSPYPGNEEGEYWASMNNRRNKTCFVRSGAVRATKQQRKQKTTRGVYPGTTSHTNIIFTQSRMCVSWVRRRRRRRRQQVAVMRRRRRGAIVQTV